MQGQRGTVEQFPEAYEFDHASSSSTWTNVPSPPDAQTLPDYLLSPNELNMPFPNVVNHETENLSNWNFGGSSSTEPMTSHNSHVETKMENGWMSSLTANASTGPTLELRRLEAGNMLSLDNISINLNQNQMGQDQLLQNPGSNDASPSLDCNAGLTGNGAQVPQTGTCPLYNPFVSEAEQIPSASCFPNSCGSSSGGARNLSEDTDGRLGRSMDSRRLSGKRKNIEGFSGQSSGSGSHSCFQHTDNGLLHAVSSRHISSSSLNVSESSGNLSNANPPEENLNFRYSAGPRRGASEYLPSVRGAESSQRNFRMRMNPANQADSSAPNFWSLGSSSGQPSVQSSHQPPALLGPFNPTLDGRLAIPSASSQNQSHLQSVPGLPRLVHPLTRSRTSSPQIGNSSNSSSSSTERSATVREEANLWSTQVNNVSEQSMVLPATDARLVAQDPTDWSLADGNISIPGTVASISQVSSSSRSRPSSTSGAHPPITLTRVPYQNRSSQYPHTPSEFVRRTFPSANSDPGGQVNDFLPQHSGHSSSRQEIARQPGVGLRTHQHQLLRSALLLDRRSDAAGPPLTLRMLAAAREGRSRIISEHIRNALDLMRRGENIRFEDVLILDQSAFHGLADLHDRHRDMRLDVDNMSYEELLALEERIGNVSTGLSEETIIKHLKQRKHLSISVTSSSEVEPCCICREDYLNGEDIGTLDCGHDFHTACIKQWLAHKNLCPICKMTALVT